MGESENKGFKVKDNRRHAADGTPVKSGPAQDARESAKPQASGAAREEPPRRQGPDFTSRPAPEADGMPEMNFSTFVLSLHASALVHLGLVEDTASGEPVEPHLPLAQQTIEILGMLAEKTRGNLAPEEKQILEGVLYELRIQFVQAARGSSKKAG